MAFCVIGGILAIPLGLLLIDDELIPETEAWIQKTQSELASPSESYYYFLGIMAPKDKDPVTLGKKLHQKALSANPQQKDRPYHISGKQLATYRPQDYCQVYKRNCFSLLLNSHLADEIIEKNSILIKRYETFISYPNYHQSHPAHDWSSNPDYKGLGFAHEVTLIKVLKSLAHNSKSGQNTLKQLESALKEKLAQSGTLLEKMFYLALLNQTLEFKNLAYSENILKKTRLSDRLSKKELALTKAVRFDLLSHYYVNKHLMRNQNKLIMPFLLKPNMTANKLTNFLEYFKLFDYMTAEDKVSYKFDYVEEYTLLESVRNYVGYTQSLIDLVPYKSYAIRLHDLDAKIAVLNWRLQQPHNAKIDEAYLERHDTAKLNPYKTGSFFIKEEELDKQKLLCVPLEQHRDPRNVRCVQL
ncbi:hypothetical protein TQ33_0663 [Kangiella geojedonensis]|uniref:Uncharacterized protein n=2 Tax=Kangiella geojedonensis TaxID=914150 RepID=A0A0F6TPS8_9GAMM|nr:hypothetical protein TQ33_0663 [Kangiella geojedonensis]